MKHHFKKKSPWKMPNEVIFDDDSTEFGINGKDAKQKIKYKPHSHPGGRKPKWRGKRKKQIIFKRNKKLGV